MFLGSVVDPFNLDLHKMRTESSLLRNLGMAGRRVFENAFPIPFHFKVVSKVEYWLTNYRKT